MKPRPEVSLSIFSFLLSEMTTQIMRKAKETNNHRQFLDPESKMNAPPIPDLETELHDLGKSIGARILDLAFYREKGSSAACSSGKREIKIIEMLCFIKDKIWKYLFGRPADDV